MTSNHDFYFSLLRVSIIQLLKSHGFDRAKPSSVDSITDLYIRYLGLLTSEIMRLAQARMDQDDGIALQDITMAFQNLGLIKPVDILDVYDENPELPSDAGVQKLLEWCVDSHSPKDARLVGLPIGDMLKTNSKTSKPLSLIPEYINQLHSDPNGETGPKENSEEEKLVEELINNGDVDDWIRLVLARQRIYLAKRIRGKEPRDMQSLPSIAGFKHTVLGGHNISYNVSYTSNKQFLPTGPDIPNEDLPPALKRGKELMRMLPVMRPDCRLENLNLSYDDIGDENEDDPRSDDRNDAEVGKDLDENQIDIPIDENEYDDMDNMDNIGGFSLDQNMDTQFDELEDMNNTFQRRQSLDYGDQQGSSRFDFSEF